MAERYGAGNQRRRIATVTISIVAFTIFGLWVAWAAWFHSTTPIVAEVSSFRVTGERTVEVKIDIRIADGAQGACLLRATAEDHATVGELSLGTAELLEGEGAWLPMRTERRASSVEVVRCDEAEQG